MTINKVQDKNKTQYIYLEKISYFLKQTTSMFKRETINYFSKLHSSNTNNDKEEKNNGMDQLIESKLHY